MDTRGKSNTEFHNELALHESNFDQINAVIQTVLTSYWHYGSHETY